MSGRRGRGLATPAARACRSGAAVASARAAGQPEKQGLRRTKFQSARGLVTATSPKPMKRFYQATSVEEHGGVWRVLLDGKPVKTPKGGSFLELPTQVVAQAVADEWAAQGEQLKPTEMALTTIGCTAVDLIRPERAECVDRLMPFLAMDTLCFEDESDLTNLAELQAKEWAPVRQWFEGHFGVTLAVASGFSPPSHPEETLAAVAEQLRARDEWELSALEIATASAKSLIVAVALLDHADVNAEAAVRLALLEEFFQIERWGLVEGEHDVSHEDLLRWLAATRRFGKHGRAAAE